MGKDLSVTRKLSSGKTLSETVIEESKDLFGSMSYEEAKKDLKPMSFHNGRKKKATAWKQKVLMLTSF